MRKRKYTLIDISSGISHQERLPTALKVFPCVNNPSNCKIMSFKFLRDGLITPARLLSSNNCFFDAMADVLSSCHDVDHKLIVTLFDDLDKLLVYIWLLITFLLIVAVKGIFFFPTIFWIVVLGEEMTTYWTLVCCLLVVYLYTLVKSIHLFIYYFGCVTEKYRFIDCIYSECSLWGNLAVQRLHVKSEETDFQVILCSHGLSLKCFSNGLKSLISAYTFLATSFRILNTVILLAFYSCNTFQISSQD